MNPLTLILEEYDTEMLRLDLAKNTRLNYLADIRGFAAWHQATYGDEDSFEPGNTVQRDVLEYRSYMLTVKQAAPSSVNRALASLNRFFGWVVSTGRSKQNPCEGVQGVADFEPSPRSLGPRELRRLLHEAHVHGSSRDIAIVELMAQTAIRIGELTQLSTSDIQISDRKGVVTIRHGKGRSARMVPLNSDVRKAVREYIATRPTTTSNYMFIGQRGERLTSSGVWRVIKKFAEMSNLPELTPHVLRHTCIRSLMAQNVDLGIIRAISGHRDMKTFMRYCMPSPNDVSEAVERLAITGE